MSWNSFGWNTPPGYASYIYLVKPEGWALGAKWKPKIEGCVYTKALTKSWRQAHISWVQLVLDVLNFSWPKIGSQNSLTIMEWDQYYLSKDTFGLEFVFQDVNIIQGRLGVIWLLHPGARPHPWSELVWPTSQVERALYTSAGSWWLDLVFGLTQSANKFFVLHIFFQRLHDLANSSQ